MSYKADSRYAYLNERGDAGKSMLACMRRMERETNGCVAVGEKHEWHDEMFNTPIFIDKDRKILGGMDQFYNPLATSWTFGLQTTGRTKCSACGEYR